MGTIKEITVGKNEAGTALYKDTGLSIEMGDKAFITTKEDVFNGGEETFYFKDELKAKSFK